LLKIFLRKQIEMKEFWDDRYAAEAFAYGSEPNVFFAGEIKKLAPGKLLLPAEGEGRNAVFAAMLGWEVTAVDQSISGQSKALNLANEKGVSLNYKIADLNEYLPENRHYDLVALIFAHFPSQWRPQVHQKLANALKPGGILILEAFSKDHLKYNALNPRAGGPREESLLYSAEELVSDFKELKIEMLSTEVVILNEGLFHCGESSVLRMIARMPMD